MRFLLLLSIILLSVFICTAQTKPRKTKTTAVVVPSPTPVPNNEPKIISLAEDEPVANNANTANKKSRQRTVQPESEQEFLRRSIGELTAEVNSLAERVGGMEEKQQQLIDLELLSRAEQRAETLHQQLFDTLTKEADVKGKLAQIEYEMRPEVIERTAGLVGTTRPEEIREARRVQLQAEKQRLQGQLSMIEQNRSRLELAVNNADLLVERLRKRLEENLDNPQPQRTKPAPKKKDKQTDTQNDDEPEKP